MLIDWFPIDAKFDGLMLSIAFPPKPVQVSAVMAVGDTSWVVVERELAHEYKQRAHRRNRHYVRIALATDPMTERLLMRKPLTSRDLC